MVVNVLFKIQRIYCNIWVHVTSYTYWSLVLLKNASSETSVNPDLITVLLTKIGTFVALLYVYIFCASVFFSVNQRYLQIP